MPTLNLGRVKAPPFIPLGAWDSGTAYVVNDLVVGTSGNAYVAIADNTAEDPEDLLGSWQTFASAGPPGSDATVNAANVAAVIAGATAKNTPVDADGLGIVDSADSSALKLLSFANLWAWIKSLGLNATPEQLSTMIPIQVDAGTTTHTVTGTADSNATAPTVASLYTGPTAGSTALCRFLNAGPDLLDSPGSNASGASRGINWTKRVTITFQLYCGTQLTANGEGRFQMGGPNSTTVGAQTAKGVSILIAGTALKLQHHDGTNLTTSGTLATINAAISYQARIVAENGTTTLYLNGVSVGSITGGPTGWAGPTNSAMRASAANLADSAAHRIQIRHPAVYLE